jgi:hypothetical protein
MRERTMVPEPEFESYYGKQVIKTPTWKTPTSRSTCLPLCGATYLVASAITRFGVFEAGLASARDPKFTVVPQRERLAARRDADHPSHMRAASV